MWLWQKTGPLTTFLVLRPFMLGSPPLSSIPTLAERHIMTVHEEQRPFRCNVCEMSFGRKGVLKKHVQMVHEHSRKFECETCKISFGLKSDLKRHVQSVHQKKRPFVCEVCSASFGRRSDLKRHTLSLHPGAEVPSKRNSGPSSSGQDTS